MSLLRSFALLNFAQIVYVISGYLIHITLARMFTPQDYGRYSVVITLATVVIILFGEGLSKALSKYLAAEPKKVKIIKKKAAILQTVLVGILTLLYYLFAPLIARILGDPTLINLLRLSSLIIPTFAAASFYANYYNGLRLFEKQALLQLIRSAARTLIIILAGFLFGIGGAIAGFSVAPLLVFIFALIVDPHKEEKAVGDFRYKKLIKFAVPVIMFMLAHQLIVNIDLFMVKAIIKDDFYVGVYNVAINLGRIPFHLFGTLALIMLPTVSNLLAAKEVKKASLLISRVLRYVLMLMIPGIFLLSSFSQPIIDLFYSQKYAIGSAPLSILVFGGGSLAIFYIVSFILNGAGKPHIPMIIGTSGAMLSIVLNYLFIKRFGLLGAAAATSSAAFIAMGLSLIFLHKYFGRLMSLGSLIKIVCASLLIWKISSFLSKDVILFIPESLALLFLYLLLMWGLKEIPSEDVSRIKMTSRACLTKIGWGRKP